MKTIIRLASIIGLLASQSTFAQSAAPSVLPDTNSLGRTVKENRLMNGLYGVAGQAGAGGFGNAPASTSQSSAGSGLLGGTSGTTTGSGATLGTTGGFAGSPLGSSSVAGSTAGSQMLNNAVPSAYGTVAGTTTTGGGLSGTTTGGNYSVVGGTSGTDGGLTLAQLAQTVQTATVVAGSAGLVDTQIVGQVTTANLVVQNDGLQLVGVDAKAPINTTQGGAGFTPVVADPNVAYSSTGQVAGQVVSTPTGPAVLKPDGSLVTLTATGGM